MRERPLRSKTRPLVEEDAQRREATERTIPPPTGSPEFNAGYRECVALYALNKPNKKKLAKILDDYQVTLEDACVRAMTRENVAQYEGYRAALKELKRVKLVK